MNIILEKEKDVFDNVEGRKNDRQHDQECPGGMQVEDATDQLHIRLLHGLFRLHHSVHEGHNQGHGHGLEHRPDQHQDAEFENPEFLVTGKDASEFFDDTNDRHYFASLIYFSISCSARPIPFR